MSTVSSTRTKVFVLAGATSSGKTALLLELFGGGHPLARAEVISADSMQVYLGMDIGTAKPGRELLHILPHRLIDILEPSEQYTVGDFVRLADKACAEISGGGSLPVVSGGTGFYLRNFICGLSAAPAADALVRAQVARDLRERGVAALREELRAADLAAAERIHPADVYRLTRAVEIFRTTGRPTGDFASPTTTRPGLDLLVVGLEREREDLYARIDRRVDEMFEAGLAREVHKLRRTGLGPEAPGMKAIGYREFFDLPPGLFDLPPQVFELRPELEAIREQIKLDTRRYAKRQMTFFRALPGILWLPPDVGALQKLVEAFLSGERLAGA